MKYGKKVFSLIIAGIMVLALAACSQQTQQPEETSSQSQQTQETTSSDTSEDANQTESVQTEQTEDTQAQAESSEDGETGNALVVYYSAAGNTETVAGYIADALGADTFEITPAEPYTAEDLNWTDENSRVTREHEDPSLRAVELTSTTVENWDSYDTVFIGYPIWWGIAAWPVDTFVEANDFTGKTVIPFCTSSSSGLGESGELLAELASTGDWQEGMRFRSSVDEADVTEWLNGLGLAQ